MASHPFHCLIASHNCSRHALVESLIPRYTSSPNQDISIVSSRLVEALRVLTMAKTVTHTHKLKTLYMRRIHPPPRICCLSILLLAPLVIATCS